MSNYVSVQVADQDYYIEAEQLPPVGTRFSVHKHLYDGGTTLLLEVVAHEWQLEEPKEAEGLAYFSVRVKTREVRS